MAEKQYIVDFFEGLKQSSEKEQQFSSDSEAMMEAAGFSSKDKEIMMSGDADLIRKHLAEDAPPVVKIFWA